MVTKCRIKAIDKTCIIDIGCNLIAIPQNLVMMMMTKLIETPHLLVNNVDDTTYNPIPLTNRSNHNKLYQNCLPFFIVLDIPFNYYHTFSLALHEFLIKT